MFAMFENFGWVVHNPIEQSIQNLSYTPAMEASSLIANVMLAASATLEHDERVRFILCCNHLSYAPMLQTLREAFPHIELVLVTDPDFINDEIAKQIDRVVNVYDLGVEYRTVCA